MTPAVYRRLLAGVRCGKRLGRTVYVHRTATTLLPGALQEVLGMVEGVSPSHRVPGRRPDLFKLGSTGISALWYVGFMVDPHPALACWFRWPMGAGRPRCGRASPDNPPILHRKELFLPPWHPSRRRFAALTAAEEAAGLLRDKSRIGTRRGWEAVLKAEGLFVCPDHTLACAHCGEGDHCRAISPEGFRCTRPRRHHGRHVACGEDDHMIAVWEGRYGSSK